MTLDQLAVLKAIAELGTMKAASEALNKTQPAISQNLKQLEHQLNVSLVDRTGYRLSLTHHGQRVYQQARRVLNEAAELRHLSEHLVSGKEASITLAVDGMFDLPVLLPILETIQQQYPETEINLRQEFLSGAIEAVTSGSADIAISPVTPDMFESLPVDVIKLSDIQLVNVATSRLINSYPELAELQQLKNAYQIVVRDSGGLTGDKEFGVQEGQRKWYVNDFYTKKVLILSGMGWGWLPAHLIHEELASGTLRELYLKNSPTKIDIQHHVLRPLHRVYGPVATQLWAEFMKYISNESLRQSEANTIHA